MITASELKLFLFLSDLNDETIIPTFVLLWEQLPQLSNVLLLDISQYLTLRDRKILLKNLPPDLDYIQGPISLSAHVSSTQNIYIFGDHHILHTGCPRIQNFLNIDQYLIRVLQESPDKMIDLYLEAPYFARGEENTLNFRKDNYLYQTLETFQKCLIHDKSLCPYKNVRIHYLDIRYSSMFPNARAINTYSDVLLELSRITWVLYHKEHPLPHNKREKDNDKENEKENGNEKEQEKKLREDLITHCKWAQENITSDNLYSFIMKYIQEPKLRKQYQNILESNMREKVWKQFSVLIGKILEEIEIQLESYHRYLRNVICLYSDETYINFSTDLWYLGMTNGYINKKLIELGSLFMDMYAMGRMLRTYRGGSRAKYLIIYAGDLHSNIYRKIFDETLGYTNTFPKIQNPSQCLDIHSITQPFFTII